MPQRYISLQSLPFYLPPQISKKNKFLFSTPSPSCCLLSMILINDEISVISNILIMAQKNSQITLQKIKGCLSLVGISQKDYLRQAEILSILSKLNNQAFDQQTFEQIWDQCKLNSKGQAKLSEFMQFMIKAEEILLKNLIGIEHNLVKLQNEKPDPNDFSLHRKYTNRLDQLQEQKQSNRINLQIIRKPFKAVNATTKKQPKINHNKDFQQQDAPDLQANNQQLFQYKQEQTSGIMNKIVYFTILLLIVTWTTSLLFNQFVNMTVSIMILTSFAFQTVSRKIVRLNLILLTISLVYSIIWLSIYTNPLWNPPINYEFATFSSPYLHFSIILIIVSLFLKLLLIYYYLTQLSINQVQAFIISFCYRNMTLQLQPSPPNPSKHPLRYALDNIINTSIDQNFEIGKENQVELTT